MALTKKSLNNFLPNGFETQNKDGYKANFSNDRIISGFEKDTLEVLSGPNLNNFIDKTGKNFNTLNDLLEYFNAMPIDSFPIVNASNQLDYKSINSFFRNVGELVFSSVPIDDKNLHLADGSLLDGKGTYRVFVDFIGGLSSKYPSLFTDEATWQATVKKYGTCAKYVWDATNKTLRIPRLKGLIEATIDKDSIGNITEAGLPNITGQFNAHNTDASGAFWQISSGQWHGNRNNNGQKGVVGFDASRSSQVYGKSNTVQPQTVKQYIYIVVSVDTEETTKLTSVFQYRGSVPTFEDLPKEGNITGDVWNVDDTDVNYVWDGAEWDQLSGSVDLTGYYTKEQADTRFATVTSLESNVENLQSKITQNTTDIASLGLGGLVASSLEKGKALKYLETKGNITEDADVYNDVYNYKHSSFDLSKFTVVGSPTITDDGLASGFSGYNYIKIGEVSQPNNNFKAKIKIRTSTLPATGHYHFINSNYNIGGFSMKIDAGGKRFVCYLSSDGQGNDIGTLIIPMDVSNNTDYWLNLSWDGQIYEFSCSTDGINFSNKIIKESNLPIYTQNRVYSLGGTSYPFTCGSIDLKQFKITIDGKEVFNGNKTGLDIVKPDNYTVVGSPTITEDGVASGFSEENYLTITLTKNITLDKVDIFDSFILNNDLEKTNIQEILFSLAEYPNVLSQTLVQLAWVQNNGVIGLALHDDTNWKGVYGTDKLKTGIKYYLHFYYKDGFIVLDLSEDGKNYYNYFTYNITVNKTFSSNKIIIGSLKSEANYFTGKKDLNSLKIYVDGELIYQPCLKIPYNISKTGLKVANADARERVIGMGEDYGYSQYFTIDEENKNATLPIGAGITGRQDLIASFDDGTNKYEQFSDLTFKQSGTCKANTAVTFIQPYKDDTYKLSVPYSAKTKTGFTPTVSGDWFAEGKIYLD